MSRACSVCSHPKIKRINQELLEGRSGRSVALKYGLHPSSMQRHQTGCIADHLRAAKEQEAERNGPPRLEALEGQVLLAQSALIHERSVSILNELESRMYAVDDDGKPVPVDIRAVVAALREVRASLESLAKLSFTVADRPKPQEQTERLEIDDAIMKALAERGVSVEIPPDKPVWTVPELRP